MEQENCKGHELYDVTPSHIPHPFFKAEEVTFTFMIPVAIMRQVHSRHFKNDGGWKEGSKGGQETGSGRNMKGGRDLGGRFRARLPSL